MTHWTGSFTTPIGLLSVVIDGEGALKRLHFGELHTPDAREDAAAITPVREQIDAYFAGERRVFDLSLAPEGTDFQRQVWDGLLTIPFGKTLSYGALADRIGRSGSPRAVGAANGANPIALIVPCHRVIGADGSLTGFAGGVPIKAALLAHEGAMPRGLATKAGARTRIEVQPAFL